MSNEKMARRWAESRNPNSLSEDARAARAYILDHTAPQSMADVEWDAEKHVLAGARLHTDNDEQVDVVMLGKDVSMIDYATLDGKPGYEHCSYFTPNGKRYELLEVTDKPECPEHPETLTTLEDYENAPEGTVVAAGRVWVKYETGDWRTTKMSWWRMDHHMKGAERRVLRWGWGE